MNQALLTKHIRNRKSYLCVGLDTDPLLLPAHLKDRPDGVIEFNKAIIGATLPYCVAYKINTAFYEAMGARGWEWMEETVRHIPEGYFKIADAKRGDIGNTSTQYARAFFEKMNFDAITVSPYMGADSVRPFLEFKNKFTIVLALTSNSGAADFELQPCGEELLYERVLRTVSSWGTTDQLMFVTGATRPESFERIRTLVPDHFLLVPGVGFQGGSLAEVSRYGMNAHVGLLVNASRAIIYASSGETFATAAAEIAQQYQFEMSGYLE
ncbi:MAG TPA: orotidine-5'-phosphate decarboxylase [Ferruginibacter sp.]|nr:orotidine-5'-phosphate decarboxylase [Ferruginibacter sp.]HRN79571.1 orotidine-5'-phosphate decarboxylase [Ferruginibacter sp.]HRO16607.1 orotidine-5'-phosphate decarboxylase [Ferruginibacter sp.]HRQ20763.1 orotidine-5'-phosphate decarboxylase [Ferruginibacter sp.]